jgi:hypothetical protein
MTVCILDTSVFCNLLRVPGRDQRAEGTLRTLADHTAAGVSLLLPIAVIFETGNHIAHCADGRERRRAAQRFVKQVTGALERRAPYVTAPTGADAGDMLAWLEEFPDAATRGVGMGDLAILQVFERQCQLNPARRVFIWSYDRHLQGHDRRP